MRPLALLLLALASPCLAEVVVRPDLSPGDNRTLAEAVAIPVGQTLRVELPYLSGTGYSWELRPPDPAILAPVAGLCPERAPGARVGGPETACFAFRAVASGATTASFAYRRPWETPRDGVLRYDLAVTAKQP